MSVNEPAEGSQSNRLQSQRFTKEVAGDRPGSLSATDPRDRLVRKLQEEIATIYSSNSWRITKPLRALQTAWLLLKTRRWRELSVESQSPSKYAGHSPQSAATAPEFIAGKIASELETVLVALPDANPSGDAILGWNLVSELQKRYNTIVLLQRGGELWSAFHGVSSGMITLPAHFPEHEVLLQGLARQITKRFSPMYGIAISVETRNLISALEGSDLPMVSLIPEFSNLASPPQGLHGLFRSASQVIFSASVIANTAARDYRELSARDYKILTPGICRDPVHSIPGVIPGRANALLEDFDGSFLVIGVGEVTLSKGVEFFIAAAARIRRDHPERKMSFAWVGKCDESEESYLAYLTEQIALSGLSTCFAFLGEFDDLEALYERADIYVLSSRLDAVPNAAIGAALRGIPVICFEGASGFADVWASTIETASLVVPYLDTESAARLILDLWADPKRLAATSEAVSSVARSHFDLQRYVDSIDSYAKQAVEAAGHAKIGFTFLLKAGRFNAHFYGRPSDPAMSYEATLKKYLHDSRLSAPRKRPLTGLLMRRPLEGFHPLIYAAQCDAYHESSGEDPLVHYLKSNEPTGPWKHQIIRAKAGSTALVHPLRAAVHGHFHYPELLDEFLDRLAKYGNHPDLFLTTTSGDRAEAIGQIIARHPQFRTVVTVVGNRGRDIGPMLTTLSMHTLLEYDVVGHFHGKRSLHVDAVMGESWRNFLWENLLGGKYPMLNRVLEAFAEDPTLGLVFAEDPHLNDWDRNLGIAEELARAMHIQTPLPQHFDFPLGTMFWARPKALQPLFDLGLKDDDFPSEPLPVDGTLLHALERLIPFAAAKQGYRYAATYVDSLTR